MDKKDLLSLLDNVVEENDTESLNRHSRVLVIDALNLFFRNFAMIGFTNESGAHVGGLGGFLRSLGTLVDRMDPTSVYIVFDGVGSTINRKNLIPEYKQNRHLSRITNWDAFDNIEEEHDAKINQLVRLIHYLKCLPIKSLSLDKVEADDIIAHLSQTLATKYNSQVFIVSSDKDFIQLVSDNITVYRPIEKDYYTPQVVKEKFGVLVENFIYYKTLLGDNSDQVKGLKGLGEKKLHKLFPELGQRPLTLSDLHDISESRLKENVIYARLIHDYEDLEKSYKVMNLHNPMLDDSDKQYISEEIEELAPDLNTVLFTKFYNEDGLRHLIKNVDYWIQSTFKYLISYNK
jgi:5'-3' exonuclease